MAWTTYNLHNKMLVTKLSIRYTILRLENNQNCLTFMRTLSVDQRSQIQLSSRDTVGKNEMWPLGPPKPMFDVCGPHFV